MTDTAIDNVLNAEAEVLENLRGNLSAYFLTLPEEGKVYTRRPPFALRLPHGDYIFVMKPTVTCNRGDYIPGTWRRTKIFTVNDGLMIECLRVLDDRHSSSMLDLIVDKDSLRKTRWMVDTALSLDALENLIELTKFFLLFPHLVFARSKDHCCCCGKRLTDEVSRCRGIGPECLQRVTAHWRDFYVEEPTPALRAHRSIYDEFSPSLTTT